MGPCHPLFSGGGQLDALKQAAGPGEAYRSARWETTKIQLDRTRANLVVSLFHLYLGDTRVRKLTVVCQPVLWWHGVLGANVSTTKKTPMWQKEYGMCAAYNSYLPGRGDTMITKVVHPGRGSAIALRLC